MARTVAMKTGSFADAAAIETEWTANWKALTAQGDERKPYLFVLVKAGTYPATVTVYVRSSLGDELDAGTAIWSVVADGAATVSAPAVSGVWTTLRYYVGSETSGVVVHSSQAGSCQLGYSWS